MPISIKTKEEIDIMREGGKRLAHVLSLLIEKAKPGVSGLELDNFVKKEMEKMGDSPSFLGYRQNKKAKPYPASVCISFNEEIVHGIPSDREIKEEDIVSFDLGLTHKGLITDIAYTIGKGKLIDITKKALYKGIDVVREGAFVGDIGCAIQDFAKGYSIFRELVGHGVGHTLHEDPYIPNFCGERGEMLKEGMTLAIEPMIGLGSNQIKLLDDGFTYVTVDGSLSAHFEHTVVVKKGGCEVLTR